MPTCFNASLIKENSISRCMPRFGIALIQSLILVGWIMPLGIDLICNYVHTMHIGEDKDMSQLELLWIYML